MEAKISSDPDIGFADACEQCCELNPGLLTEQPTSALHPQAVSRPCSLSLLPIT